MTPKESPPLSSQTGHADAIGANAGRRRAARKSGLAENETRLQIVNTAERLFADNGLSGVSLRTIVAEAGVNLAAIHYHFGSKEALFEAVFARRATVIASERAERLEELSARTELPELEEVLMAFLAPGLRPDKSRANVTGGAMFARLRARLTSEDSDFGRALQSKYFDSSSQGFVALLGQILPHLSQAELYWRFHFMLGSMMYQMANVDRVAQLSKGRFSTSDSAQALEKMVIFFAAAFRRPEDKRRSSSRAPSIRRKPR